MKYSPDLLEQIAKLYYEHKKEWFKTVVSECKKEYSKSWSKLTKKRKEEIKEKAQEFIDIMRQYKLIF